MCEGPEGGFSIDLELTAKFLRIKRQLWVLPLQPQSSDNAEVFGRLVHKGDLVDLELKAGTYAISKHGILPGRHPVMRAAWL